jgi:metallo-beta-lactamase family protein
MWYDSSYINQRDCEYLSDKFEKEYTPLYSDNEVELALDHVDEYEFDKIFELDNFLKFKFIHAGHILFSAQTELFISLNNSTKKIVFTSDIGNTKLNNNKVFVEKFSPIVKSNIVIGEATYASSSRSMNKKDLQNDLDKIKTVITQFCVENKKIVVIPTFSLDRLPYMLWLLYSIFGKDENFNIPIIVDSPLSIRLLNAYSESLQGDAKDKFDLMMNWKNVKFAYTPEESKSVMADGKAKCVLSSSGMLQAGRSVKWVQHILPNQDNCILFIGYATTNTLAYKIKNGKEQKTISINGKAVKNRAAIVDLHSFSSHMQHDDLLKYYSSINCEKIYLVHSNQDEKISFKKELETELSNKCKTTKVIAVNKSTKITL